MSSPPRRLAVGKLPPDLLASLLARIPAPSVVVGAQPGEDAAVVEIDGRYLILANDPVTLSAEPGRIAVQINANDIAVMGGEPRWLLATLLLPAGSTVEIAERVMGDIVDGCSAINIALIGGHTEITPSVNRPIVVGTMVGETRPDRLVTSSGGRPGDVLILARPVAIEGAAILAREEESLLRERGVPSDVIASAAALLDAPGISVLPLARTVLAVTLPHVMHDPTEGGLLSAVREVAVASEAGVHLNADAVPVDPSCATICAALGLDPLALVASGSLLAAVVPEAVADVIPALAAVNVTAAAIGEFHPQSEGLMMTRHGETVPLPIVERDELARFAEARG